MPKIHISKNGTAEKCTASTRQCPCGAHFDTIEEAQHYLDQEGEASQLKEKLSEYSNVLHKRGIKSVIENNFPDISANSINTKATELAVLLETMDKNALYGAENSKLYKVDNGFYNGDFDDTKKAEIYEIVNKIYPNKFYNQGDKLPVHAVGEDSQYWYIWTNNSKDRDVVAVFKAVDSVHYENGEDFPIEVYNKINHFVDRIEVKDITTMAQLSALDCKMEGTHLVTNETAPFVTDKIKQQLNEYNILNDAYSNKRLNLTREEEQDYMLGQYYHKGATEIVLKGKRSKNDTEETTIRIRLTEEDYKNGFPKAKALLDKKGVEISVNIRCNNIGNSKKMSKSDKEYVKKYYGSMFKGGVVLDEFTADDLILPEGDRGFTSKGEPGKAFKRRYNTKNERYTQIRIGNLFDKKRRIFLPNEKIRLDDLKFAMPIVTGNIFFANKDKDK